MIRNWLLVNELGSITIDQFSILNSQFSILNKPQYLKYVN